MSEMTQRYAAALLEAAGSDAPAVRAAGDALLADTARWNALTSPAATPAEKQQLLADAPMLAGCDALKAFLNILADADALADLPAILAEFSRLALAAQGGVACRVTCARQPDEATQQTICKAAC